MRLLHTTTGEIKEFFGQNIPSQYAILSHRWREGEVSFQEWTNNSSHGLSRRLPPRWRRTSSQPDVQLRQGYMKIKRCLERARNDNFDWLWVDTCCIDKTSSQELSEAINSMFQWYKQSSICYAYLWDYDHVTFEASRFKECDWWLRGWTLQELIAPRRVEFYSGNWQYLGARDDTALCSTIAEITKIDMQFLCGAELESASVAKRMSWASNRQTTRLEDEAYCLLGVFGINMPLLYGEGSNAFTRLQKEIMRKYPEDHSLYAWGIPTEKCSANATQFTSDRRTIRALRESLENQTITSEPFYGILAASPSDFKDSRHYSPVSWSNLLYLDMWTDMTVASRPSEFGKGVVVSLPVSNWMPFFYRLSDISLTEIRPGAYAILLCEDDTDEEVTLFVPFIRWGSGFYARTRELYRNRDFQLLKQEPLSVFQKTHSMTIVPEQKTTLRSGDVILRSMLGFESPNSGATLPAHYFFRNYKQGVSGGFDRTIRIKHLIAAPYECLSLESFPDEGQDLSILLGRVAVETSDRLAFQLGIGLCDHRGPDMDEWPADFIYRVFDSPMDEHTFDTAPHPRIMIGVERRDLSAGDGFVDIVDIIVTNRPSPENSNAPIGMRNNPPPSGDQLINGDPLGDNGLEGSASAIS